MKSASVLATTIFASSLLGILVAGGLTQTRPLGGGSHRLEDSFRRLDSAHNLYAVSGEPDYVLQIVLSSENQIAEIQVVPKFFFEKDHPDWIEPPSDTAMPSSKYRQILDQVGQVYSFGKLQRPGKVGSMSNLRLNFADEYEGAVVQRAMFRHSPQEDYKVAWFSVKYFRPISGKLQRKWVNKLDRKYIVKVDDEPYWTRKTTFGNLKVGAHVSIEAAGPISNR